MKGYLNRPEATAEAVVDGWFRSGDLGTKDEDGYLTIVDRKKDMIIRNGYNVYPREVEEILLTHPEVVSAAVYGVPHDVHGQEIAAAIVLDAGATCHRVRADRLRQRATRRVQVPALGPAAHGAPAGSQRKNPQAEPGRRVQLNRN